MKFSIKGFDQIRKEMTNLVTFVEEIINGKLKFLCSEIKSNCYVIVHIKQYGELETNVALWPGL